ncbi:MAG: hypothetical protein NTX61_13640 [Bacteroidetes bacterium]|nr:hypothetical protein [Bacteroidota bacterium]
MTYTENSQNIDRLSHFIKKYTELISLIIDRFSEIDRTKDLLGFCNFIFLNRFYYNSLGIRSLLPSLKKDLYYKIPIGIILRTCISDALTYFYFFYLAKTNSDPNKFLEELKGFLAENLHYLKKHLENEKKEGKLSDEQYRYLKSSFIQGYKEYFLPNSTELIPKKHLDFKTITNLLKSNPEFAWTAPAYEYYNYLSKYEHFGALTFDIQEFHKNKPLYDVKGYIICVGLVYEAVISIV